MNLYYQLRQFGYAAAVSGSMILSGCASGLSERIDRAERNYQQLDQKLNGTNSSMSEMSTSINGINTVLTARLNESLIDSRAQGIAQTISASLDIIRAEDLAARAALSTQFDQTVTRVEASRRIITDTNESIRDKLAAFDALMGTPGNGINPPTGIYKLVQDVADLTNYSRNTNNNLGQTQRDLSAETAQQRESYQLFSTFRDTLKGYRTQLNTVLDDDKKSPDDKAAAIAEFERLFRTLRESQDAERRRRFTRLPN